MNDRPSIFPQFSVNIPMPAGVKPPKGSFMPDEISWAIDALEVRAEQFGGQTFIQDGDGSAVIQARADLEAVILKHLRGEA